MKDLKIVVIDNGVDRKLLYYLLGDKLNMHSYQIYKDKCIFQSLAPKPEGGRTHGTLCLALLVEFLKIKVDIKQVEFTSISIINRKGKQEINDFISALKWCCNKNYDLILLSVGVKTSVYTDTFTPIIKHLKSKKSIIVAAASNDGGLTYPACLNSVIGVKYSGSMQEKRVIIQNAVDGIEITASFEKSRVLEKYNKRSKQKYPPSNSFIVPYIASFVCLYLQKSHKIRKNDILDFLKTYEDFICVNCTPQKQSNLNMAPFVIITYEVQNKNSVYTFLRKIIYTFRLQGYACVCVTDIYSKSDFNKNILSLPLQNVEEYFSNYLWLLSDNSLILFYVDKNTSLLPHKYLSNVIDYSEKIAIDKIIAMILKLN